MEDHIVADTQRPDDAATLRSALARQYGHFAEHLSRASFEQLIDELALARMRDSLGMVDAPFAAPPSPTELRQVLAAKEIRKGSERT